MKLPRTLLLFFKGVFMGVADVIPGVSGGTIALIVGIYRELIHSLKSLNLHWVGPLLDLLLGRENPEATDRIRRSFDRMNLWFLLPLGAGILTAIGVGSTFIPALLANYPTAVHALFFGLILASVWIPFKMVETASLVQGVLAGGIGVIVALMGFYVSNPNLRLIGSIEWVEIKSEGRTFKTILEDVPSSRPAHRVYWSQNNRRFRREMDRRAPRQAALLKSKKKQHVAGLSPKETLKARSEPYENITIPAGTSVMVPRLSYWYVFLVGSVAISAMILPGISGSYFLLILGSYFFVMNSVHGFLDGLVRGDPPINQGLIVVLFSLGAIAGLLAFTRLLDYLLEQWVTFTAAGLSGLMVGCLRGIWPFRRVTDGRVMLYVPDRFSSSVLWALVMFLIGFVLVVALNYMPDGQNTATRTTADN